MPGGRTGDPKVILWASNMPQEVKAVTIKRADINASLLDSLMKLIGSSPMLGENKREAF